MLPRAALLASVALFASACVFGGDDDDDDGGLENLFDPDDSPTSDVLGEQITPTGVAGAATATATNTVTAPDGTAAVEYTIQPGDTLGQVALNFGVELKAILDINDIDNPALIFPGDVILIPQ